MAQRTTTQLTVTLPNSVIDILRAKVCAGEYPDESAAVEAAIIDSLLPPFSDEDISDDWLRKEVVPVLEAMNADPSRGLTIEQVRENLARRHKIFRKAG
jgi:Arc/MetJ-type ribon-helix-helix transcriptional regulator